MRLTVGRDWKLRNERGEIVGALEPSFHLVIDTHDGGAAKGGRGTGGGFAVSSQDGQPPTSEQDAADDDEQVALVLQDAVVAREDVPARVWEHYVAVMKPRAKDLDPQTRTVIREALKVATEQECAAAINGCRASSWHMGENDRRRKYNQITQILKGKRGGQTARERIDFFLDLAEKSGVQSGLPSGDPGRIRRAKQDVRDAHEMPGDDHIVARGKTSEEYLMGLGWRITRDETGWPSFVEPS